MARIVVALIFALTALSVAQVQLVQNDADALTEICMEFSPLPLALINGNWSCANAVDACGTSRWVVISCNVDGQITQLCAILFLLSLSRIYAYMLLYSMVGFRSISAILPARLASLTALTTLYDALAVFC